MGRFVNLVGKKFGKLTVIARVDDDKSKKVMWLCECECGKRHITRSNSLTSGLRKSCGCMQINNNRGFIPKNHYDLTGEFGIGYTSKGEKFLFDKADYEKIKNINWYDCCGYIVGNDNTGVKQKQIKMHRLIMNYPNDKAIDHISGDKHDNRKQNLRICSIKENNRNTKVQQRNKTGIKGVTFTHCNTYQSQIQVDGKLKYLGTFKTAEEAAKVYNEAALKYFGEFARIN